jgi:hypothetical protein
MAAGRLIVEGMHPSHLWDVTETGVGGGDGPPSFLDCTDVSLRAAQLRHDYFTKYYLDDELTSLEDRLDADRYQACYRYFLLTGRSRQGVLLVPDMWSDDIAPPEPSELRVPCEARLVERKRGLTGVSSDQGGLVQWECDEVAPNSPESAPSSHTCAVSDPSHPYFDPHLPRPTARFWRMDVRLYYGSEEASTRLLQEEFGEEVYFKQRGGSWDGYHGQECVALMSLPRPACSAVTMRDLARLCGPHSYEVEDVSGRKTAFVSRVIVFLSSRHPREVMRGDDADRFMSYLTSTREVRDEE